MSGSPPSIMVVDDTPTNLIVMQALLDDDYDLHCFESGQECLDNVASVEPDLILLDVMMPDMNGYEVCQKLRQGKDTYQIPVVMLSGLDEREQSQKDLDGSADGYIEKPINESKLFEMLNKLL